MEKNHSFYSDYEWGKIERLGSSLEGNDEELHYLDGYDIFGDEPEYWLDFDPDYDNQVDYWDDQADDI